MLQRVAEATVATATFECHHCMLGLMQTDVAGVLQIVNLRF